MKRLGIRLAWVVGMISVQVIFLIWGLAVASIGATEGKAMIRTGDLRIRDPFILPVPEEKRYYLYASKGPAGFQAYRSSDLKEWEGPITVFETPSGFWADRDFWAPEVHHYRGKYYLFASLKSEKACRGTQIFEAASPAGPFKPISSGPMTPKDWECLDGTLYVDPEGNPWMVFCHEWLQVHDGEICAVPLSPDLRKAVGKPVLLFHATDAPWAPKPADKRDFITDGPFLYRLKSGELLMLWSSFGKTGYAQAIARSKSGRILGPWVQEPEPIFADDGGHGMLFRTFAGELMLVLHAPNSGDTRVKLIPILEEKNRLVAKGGNIENR